MHLKKPRLLLSALSVLLAGFVPLQAQAHRTWLLPSATQIESKDPWVTIDAAVSENLFEFDTTPLKLDGLSVTGPDGETVKAENQFTGHLRNSIDVKLAKAGTYKASLATESMMANYTLNGEAKRWRGSAETFAKEVPTEAEKVRITHLHNRVETYFTAGKSSDINFKLSGVGLELVPITHPNELSAGQKAQFRMLIDGKPAADLGVSLVPGGVRYRGVLGEIRVNTDVKGEFSITWPAAGMYWLSANYPQRAAPTADGKEAPADASTRRLSYAATLEVLPQ